MATVRRNLESSAREVLADTPVLVIQGARQVGKSTLADRLSGDGSLVLNLDEPSNLALARDDPTTFLAGASDRRLVIDEVQRAPDLLLAVKASVDRDRRPGRFILTGSANLLHVPTIHESLAGRAETLHLHSFSQGELAGVTEDWVTWFLSIHAEPPRDDRANAQRSTYAELITAGGYPEAVARPTGRRQAWFRNYLSRVLDHDAPEIRRLAHRSEAHTLLELIAANGAGEMVKARLARGSGIPETTVPSYIDLLEDLGLVHRIKAWGNNLTQRVVGRERAAVLDAGLAAALTRQSTAQLADPAPTNHLGGMLETFVAGELRRQQGWTANRFELRHFRDRRGNEVDLVLELDDGRIIGVEVKSTATPLPQHLTGLKLLRDRLGDRFAGGALLHTGSLAGPFGDRIAALPIESLWHHEDD